MRVLMAASSLVIVLATSAAAQVDGMEFGVTVPVSTTGSVVREFLVPGLGENATVLDEFELRFDAAWLSVFPQRGALSAGGTTVQFTINPGFLPVGTTTTTVIVERTQGPVRTPAVVIPFSVHRVPHVT